MKGLVSKEPLVTAPVEYAATVNRAPVAGLRTKALLLIPDGRDG